MIKEAVFSEVKRSIQHRLKTKCHIFFNVACLNKMVSQPLVELKRTSLHFNISMYFFKCLTFLFSFNLLFYMSLFLLFICLTFLHFYFFLLFCILTFLLFYLSVVLLFSIFTFQLVYICISFLFYVSTFLNLNQSTFST